ncbi:hypothetical protein KPL47_23185 [Clostridium estertheticum]|uniref:hypothetical protein n=1 Tax=Clostridium estertheticum TaxID=238834 RepID=UPI001C0ACB4C|nr:hypothetical protein [Clostridium estertheticum]MBU3179200.1 hypothetical protein [Clostridium estertheticum]
MRKVLLPLLMSVMLFSSYQGETIPSKIDSMTITASPSPTKNINESDSIIESDEKIIKEFRSHHNYSDKELKNLAINYLGDVDGFRVYFVPFKGSSGVLNEKNWTKDNYIFPIKSQTRIIGIKEDKLYTLGNLIHETNINIKALYTILPKEYK